VSNQRAQDVVHMPGFCTQFKPAILSSLGTTRAVSLAAKPQAPAKQGRISARHRETLSSGAENLPALL